MTSLTEDQIKKMVAYGKRHAIKPKLIKSAKEAREMTRNDPLGQKWRKGDEYYVLRDISSDRNIKADS